MDDNEYYSMMRRQYSNPIRIRKNSSSAFSESQGQTPGSFKSWEKKYGHEDAEMFLERNTETTPDEE